MHGVSPFPDFFNIEQIDGNTKSVVYNNDFIEFTDYFVLRRDIENCDDDELGCLAQLHAGFQKTIEKELNKSKPDFVAIDFEHATHEKGSICSVGIVSFKNGEIIDKYNSFVQPKNNEYEKILSQIHNINSYSTENAPSFIEIFPEIYKRLNNNVVVAHGAFHTDKVCLEQAIRMNNIESPININWVCTQEICNCGLDIACKVCNIDLSHHDALSDAIGCGILYSKYLKNDLPLDEFQRVKNIEKASSNNHPNHYPKQLTGDVLTPDFKNAKNKQNPFYMKKVVITGFGDNEKKKIANELKELGADVDSTVGSRTNFLIIGENAGPSKLSKMQANIAERKEAKILTWLEYDELKK